ncbi:MAG: ATP-dependent DNA helicase RecG [Lachnospiraceae bacterium]|nr:ATP-dependent DNA helicase RecG [Lachnospiraceae bacterium]
MKKYALEDELTKIKGIGPKSAALFEKLGVKRIEDLLYFYPSRYEEFEEPLPVRELQSGALKAVEVTLQGEPVLKRFKGRVMTTVIVGDVTGNIRAVWFNMPYISKTLKSAVHYVMRGNISAKGGMMEIIQPKLYSRQEYQLITGRLLPVYHLVKGLTNNAVTKAISAVIEDVEFPEDYLSLKERRELGVCSLTEALKTIHFPKNKDDVIKARKRLVFDELFTFSVKMQLLKSNDKEHKNGYVVSEKNSEGGSVLEEFKKSLPFELTKAQSFAVEKISKEMSGEATMNMLLQGDVGSGKTAVAAAAMYMAVKSGYQAALMAPTQVLAVQHYGKLAPMFEKLGISTVLLNGGMSAAKKKEAAALIASHEADVIIGTNALIQGKVEYDKLALVITDEQHRFGVKQREALSLKGTEGEKQPHVLCMSATPIPRTLAIILYADMDICVLNELPAGRLPIKNAVVDPSYRPKAWNFIRNQISEGRQAYIVCPMIDENDTLELENVTQYVEDLRSTLPPSIRIDSLTGKMKPAEKDAVLEKFAAHETDILVSTTVIEVGIDVPNCTVMLIENAERFGLASLHQLRGRVGRGSNQSYCIFMSGKFDKDTMKRLEVMRNSNDGFKIAEEDLKMRGPGDFFGIRQSGEMDFKLADIYQDSEVLIKAAQKARELSEEELAEMSERFPIHFML